MEADAPLDGAALLGNRYVLGDLVGRGGMAQVYRAHDRVLGRTVAVKMMRAIATGDEERARFTDEARMLARLSHPGLVTVLDAAVSDDTPYLVMELVDGPSLAEHCRDVALEPARVAAIGAQLADALGHVHAAGIVHRDLKPANVLLAEDGRAQLTDFGLARSMSAVMRHTTSGATVGTPAYLAPEQVRGTEVTPAADVYALGLVLIEALTGDCPYQGLPVEAALARLTTPPAIPDALPRPWHLLLREMTALDPADRPSTARAADALRRLASAPDSPVVVLGRFAADRWHLAAGVTAGVLLVLLTGAWYSDNAVDDRPPGSAEPQVSGSAVDDPAAPGVEAFNVWTRGVGIASGATRAGDRVDARAGTTRPGSARGANSEAGAEPASGADGDGTTGDRGGGAADTAQDGPTADDGRAQGSTLADPAAPEAGNDEAKARNAKKQAKAEKNAQRKAERKARRAASEEAAAATTSAGDGDVAANGSSG